MAMPVVLTSEQVESPHFPVMLERSFARLTLDDLCSGTDLRGGVFMPTKMRSNRIRLVNSRLVIECMARIALLLSINIDAFP
jgi:hypothetical protein